MLILRRKAGESLQIGDEVRLTVVDIYEGGVRIAIDAPRRITVLRTELLQAADANRESAAGEQGQPGELLELLSAAPSAQPAAPAEETQTPEGQTEMA